ncbi:MAG: hypothetical protein WB609_08225 [Candidatus Cybelea sp.]
MLELLKRPTGFLPLAISTAFLVPLLVGIAKGTLVREADEGSAAHLFQLLLPLQLVVIAWFAASWLPKRPRSAAQVLCLQGAAFLAVLSIVYFRHL